MDAEALTRAAYAKFAQGDIPGLLASLSPDILWESNLPSGSVPWGGARHGIAGALSFFQALGENIDFEAFEPREFFAGPVTCTVMGHTKGRIKSTGKTYQSAWMHLFVWGEDGKLRRFHEFYDTHGAVMALTP